MRLVEDISRYVVKNPSGIYRYYRRVPTEVAHLDKRSHVWQSLKTRSLSEALQKAQLIHDATEDLWRSMLSADPDSAVNRYKAAARFVQSLGYTYRPAAELATAPYEEIHERLDRVRENRQQPALIQAVTGFVDKPQPKVSDIWNLYEEHNATGLAGLSANQMRKHKVARERAIRYVQDLLGDVELASITREDVLRYRNWWAKKIEAEKLKADSANRSFSDLTGMIRTIDDALHTKFLAVWEKSRLKESNANEGDDRPPFPVEWIRDKLMAKDAFKTEQNRKLDEDCQFIIYTIIETGMRISEVCNLRPEDIRLDDPVPHLVVGKRADRRQKTSSSIRQVPLVGIALWAMKQRPKGFPKYHDKGDTASANINKFMKNNGLRPTDQHTLYSLRHTFQDRIENAGCSDRMQADLMGHEFGRPKYGDGAEMQRRQAFLESIKIPCAWIE